MRHNCILLSVAQALWLVTASHAGAAEVNVTRTNWTERWITNVIDVQMPLNKFVNEYHTNYFEKFHTNIVERQVTNWFTRMHTNVAYVQAFHTNHVTAYRTNVHTATVTNVLAVNLVQTNFTDRYQTNVSVLTLTNWQTVLVMRTNWVTQPVTNVAQIDITAPASQPAPRQEQPASATLERPGALVVENGLVLEATRTRRTAKAGAAEVELLVRCAVEGAPTPVVRTWKVESEDGAILCSSPNQEFRSELPFGSYRVEVLAWREKNGPLLKGHATLQIRANEASLQPKPLAKN